MVDPRRTGREWLADVCAAICAAALGLLVLAGSVDSFPEDKQDGRVVRDIAIGAVACLVLLLYRRRWPVALAITLMLVQITSSTAYGSAAIAVYTVAVHRPWKVTAWVAAATLGVITTVFSLAGLSAREFRDGLVVFYLGYGLLVAIGLVVRSRRELIRSLRERAREAEEGQRLRVEEARLLERERLAREMHDVLAHRISLLAVHAGALEFGADAPREQREAAGIIRQSAYEAMEDLREVIGVLRDDEHAAEPDRPQPALSDIPALVAESREAGAHIELEVKVLDPAAVPARVGRHAYRIVQEGLTNARKHAPGAHVHVTVEASGGELVVDITNPLPRGAVAHPGPPPMPGAGAGLVGLGERVALVGGTIDHGRTGDRFRLRARLPLPHPASP
ncbi:histidine kinase [Actinomadura barringtoniae]|uniref:histidine kinase n=1 Tax=Actinomadura barringtoniae TaxID=1427535 RepID=A0A939PK51_9ACTN|nr:sensor histidine kinase [Actinomadura barringtoniae]MBO2450046.1 histidine kinase [Actinomadura barringtoniae]